MFKIVIPSYNRFNTIKLNVIHFLTKYELLNSDIFIFTPQLKEYKNVLQGLNINLVECKQGLINARNEIRNYFPEGENLVIMDDDVKDVKLDGNLKKEIKESFRIMKKNKIILGSINPTGNEYFRKNEYLIGLYLCVGCFYFEINNKNPGLYLDTYDLFQDEKEDYLRTLKTYHLSGAVFRNDKINIVHKMGKTPGGMNNQNRDLNFKKAVKYIEDEYKLFIFKKTTPTKTEIFFKNPVGKYFDIPDDLKNFVDQLQVKIKKLCIPFKTSREATAGKGRSIVFGYTRIRRLKGFHLSKYSQHYPEIYNNLLELGHYFKFPFSSIMVNKNFKCEKHVDNNKPFTNNLILGFGDFSGGELVYNCKEYNINNKFLIFDGRKEHYVRPFNGERWTLTFFLV